MLSSSRLNPVSLLAAVLVFLGAFGLLRDRMLTDPSPPQCDPAAGSFCVEDDGSATGTASRAGMAGGSPAFTVGAEEACRDAGYLCADLAHTDRVQIRRWKEFSGTVVVHVPRPDFEDPGDAVRLQQAAAAGLRAWNGQPYQIMTDLRGDRGPHFAVRWTRSLGGNQIGVARTQWSPGGGLTVVSIELTTRSPFAPGRVIEPRQIQLTAAHEMGHALGLPHSDSQRDVMYPTNTATSLSAQDYRTMEVLYEMADGIEITR